MTIAFLDLNGARLWITTEGQGPPLLLTPGGPGCCDYLDPVAGLLSGDMRVTRWEPRGCGESSPDGPHDVATTVADMDAIREALGHETWFVGGHSHGAFYALAYAMAHPDQVRGVLYLAGAGLQRDRHWSEVYHHGLDTVGEYQIPFRVPPNMAVNREAIASFADYVHDPMLWKWLAALDVPFLAVQGGRDIRPNWPVEQLVNVLPNAELRILPDEEHHLWLEHPERLREIILGFVRSIP